MSKISVVQIFKKNNQSENLDKIISNNSDFLHKLNVEYIVLDHLESYNIVTFIKKHTNLKYFREKFTNSKKSFLQVINFVSKDTEKIIFLKSNDLLSFENIELLEKKRPNLYKNKISKLVELKESDFKFDNFNLIMKEKKTWFEKIYLFFT